MGNLPVGVTPTRPDYQEFEVSPALGDLESFQGKVPINYGTVRVKIAGETIDIETNADGGYYVNNGRRIKLAPGQVNRFRR